MICVVVKDYVSVKAGLYCSNNGCIGMMIEDENFGVFLGQ